MTSRTAIARACAWTAGVLLAVVASAQTPPAGPQVRMVPTGGQPGDSVILGQTFQIEATVPYSGDPQRSVTVRLSTPGGSVKDVTLHLVGTENGVARYSTGTYESIGGKRGGLNNPGTINDLKLTNGEVITAQVVGANGPMTGSASNLTVYDNEIQQGIGRNRELLDAIGADLVAQRREADAILARTDVPADVRAEAEQWRQEVDRKLGELVRGREAIERLQTPLAKLRQGNKVVTNLVRTDEIIDTSDPISDREVVQDNMVSVATAATLATYKTLGDLTMAGPAYRAGQGWFSFWANTLFSKDQLGGFRARTEGAPTDEFGRRITARDQAMAAGELVLGFVLMTKFPKLLDWVADGMPADIPIPRRATSPPAPSRPITGEPPPSTPPASPPAGAAAKPSGTQSLPAPDLPPASAAPSRPPTAAADAPTPPGTPPQRGAALDTPTQLVPGRKPNAGSGTDGPSTLLDPPGGGSSAAARPATGDATYRPGDMGYVSDDIILFNARMEARSTNKLPWSDAHLKRLRELTEDPSKFRDSVGRPRTLSDADLDALRAADGVPREGTQIITNPGGITPAQPGGAGVTGSQTPVVGPQGTQILPKPDLPSASAASRTSPGTATERLPAPDLPPPAAETGRPGTGARPGDPAKPARLDVGTYDDFADLLEAFHAQRAHAETVLGKARVEKLLEGVDLTDPKALNEISYRLLLERANAEGSLKPVRMIEDATGKLVRPKTGDAAEIDALAAEGRRLAEIHTRLSTGRLTEADIAWLRQKTAADPDYFKSVSKRGYILEKDGLPLDEPNFLLQPDQATALENAVRTWPTTGSPGAAPRTGAGASAAGATPPAAGGAASSSGGTVPPPGPTAPGGAAIGTSRPETGVQPVPMPIVDPDDPLVREARNRMATGLATAGAGVQPVPMPIVDPDDPLVREARNRMATGLATAGAGVQPVPMPIVDPDDPLVREARNRMATGGAGAPPTEVGVVPSGPAPATSIPPIAFTIEPGERRSDDEEPRLRTGGFLPIDLLNDTGLIASFPGGGGAPPLVQVMIVSAASIQAPVSTPRRARLETPFSLWAWLRGLPARLTDNGAWRASTAQPALRSQRNSSPAAAAPVKLFLSSLGVSTGEAFEVQVVNDGMQPVELSGEGIVIEPLDTRAQAAGRAELQKVASRATPAGRLDAYCLEFLRQPPSPGMLFRVANREMQQKFAPMRRIVQTAKQLEAAGLLTPDSNPLDYFHSITQWALWSREQGFDEKKFGQAFVDHTRKNFRAAGQAWTQEVERAVLGVIPGRWRDIAQVLTTARPAGGPDAPPGPDR